MRKIEKSSNPVIEEGFSSRSVAVMTKFNELAERHGIDPVDVEAKLLFHDDTFYLTVAAIGVSANDEKLGAMLKSVKLEQVDSRAISDNDSNIALEARGLGEIQKALSAAVDLAPRNRGGFAG